MEELNTAWRKSSHSGANGGNCVEVATAGAVLVRDSKDENGAVLAFARKAWETFAAKVKAELAPDISASAWPGPDIVGTRAGGAVDRRRADGIGRHAQVRACSRTAYGRPVSLALAAGSADSCDC
jgi:hypothetical protein